MSSKNNTVTVKILDKDYQVACPEEQEAQLVMSAKYLDKQMRSIRETGNPRASAAIWAITVLDPCPISVAP